MPLHVLSTCAHHQEVKIVLYSIWYHHTYRCDDTRGCVIQLWPPDDEPICSKHVETWNKLIAKQKCCASSWLITEINILRCTVSKTSKFIYICSKNFALIIAYSHTSSSSVIVSKPTGTKEFFPGISLAVRKPTIPGIFWNMNEYNKLHRIKTCKQLIISFPSATFGHTNSRRADKLKWL